MGDMTEAIALDDPAEVISPEQRLALAAVGRYALDLLRPAGDGAEALDDLHGDGVILARLCGFADLDVDDTRAALFRLADGSAGLTMRQLMAAAA